MQCALPIIQTSTVVVFLAFFGREGEKLCSNLHHVLLLFLYHVYVQLYLYYHNMFRDKFCVSVSVETWVADEIDGVCLAAGAHSRTGGR